MEAEDGVGVCESPCVWALWEAGDEVEGGEGEGGCVLGGCVWDGACGEDGCPVGCGDGFHGLCVGDSEDARGLVDLIGNKKGWWRDGDVVEFVGEILHLKKKKKRADVVAKKNRLFRDRQGNEKYVLLESRIPHHRQLLPSNPRPPWLYPRVAPHIARLDTHIPRPGNTRQQYHRDFKSPSLTSPRPPCPRSCAPPPAGSTPPRP